MVSIKRIVVLLLMITAIGGWSAMFAGGARYGVNPDTSPAPCSICFTEAEVRAINERQSK